MMRMFDGLLRIARLEAKTSQKPQELMDVGAILLDVIDLYEPLAAEKDMTISLSTEPDIYAQGDPHLLGQAVANLIENAVKYGCSARQHGSADILVGASIKQGILEITVSDHGPGIPFEDRARVLERFVRLEKSRSQPGTGLGLSLVAAAAHSLDGSLELGDNHPGLVVRFRIPA